MRRAMSLRNPAWRRLAALLLVAAFAVRALVPAGYMFDETEDGLVVRMCGGGEPSYVRVNLSAGKADVTTEAPGAPAQHDRGKDGTCLFAVASIAVPHSFAVELPSPARGPPVAHETFTQTVHALAAAGAPMPARGPPAHA